MAESKIGETKILTSLEMFSSRMFTRYLYLA